MIKTKRLILRQWREEDFEPFAKMNADPRVMEYFPKLLTREESDQAARKAQTGIKEKGWGWWVAEVDGKFIGFIGIDDVRMEVPFVPAVEIGWRLAYDYWNQGYATEGALACLEYAFNTLGLNEIVAFTAADNQRSQNVMKKIGMHRNPADDFDHPKLPEGHPLRRHVLYRISKSEWK